MNKRKITLLLGTVCLILALTASLAGAATEQIRNLATTGVNPATTAEIDIGATESDIVRASVIDGVKEPDESASLSRKVTVDGKATVSEKGSGPRPEEIKPLGPRVD